MSYSWYVLWYTIHSVVYTCDLILARIWLLGLCSFINRVLQPRYRQHQQGARRCNPKILPDIKAEITKLIEAKFIRQCIYAEWMSNVVFVYKKNGKLRVCIDFRNLNKSMLMDGYPMPVAICWWMLLQDIKWSVSGMGMPDIIRYSWLRKTFIKLHSDVQGMSVCSNGLSWLLDWRTLEQHTREPWTIFSMRSSARLLRFTLMMLWWNPRSIKNI